MKEIGMEKLIELLNEYERNVVMKSYMHPVYYYNEDENKILNLYIGFNTDDEVKYQWLLSYIVSARYGFIKWLVENDKIDLDNEELVSLMSELGERRNPVKCLLMLLAIQDEPIRFLCEVIK